jgi:hypothetical protein
MLGHDERLAELGARRPVLWLAERGIGMTDEQLRRHIAILDTRLDALKTALDGVIPAAEDHGLDLDDVKFQFDRVRRSVEKLAREARP